MSSTRIAKPGTPFRQNRFASAYPSGLLANLVAKRCAQIEDPTEREPIWFLQLLSWQPGGLAAHVDKIFPANQLKFNSTEELEKQLFETCLSDEFSPCCDPDWELAAAYRERWIKENSVSVETTIGHRVFEVLDYARSTRSLVSVDGPAHIGKSFSARAYCEGSGGLARYVAVPYSEDNITFYRHLALALGVSSSLQLKALQLRTRVEEVLQGGDLLLVLDRAEWLFPQTGRNYSLPSRINWICSMLVDVGAPVALITSPDFHTSQKRVEKQTGWASTSFTGRIAHTERLPGILPIKDLLCVAQSIFPEGDKNAWQMLAGYADLNPQTKLAGMASLVKRARWIANQKGRIEATPDDLSSAMRETGPTVAVHKSRAVSLPGAVLPPIRRDTGASITRPNEHDNFTRRDAIADRLVTQ